MKLWSVDAPQTGPDTVAVVAEALVPFMYWRGVPVQVTEPRELTVLERLVLEMGLSLGSVEPADFAEVTDLPPSVLAGAAWRLVAAGVLFPQRNGYGVQLSGAERTLRRQAVARVVDAAADFVLLPRSGDLLAFGGGPGGWLRGLDQKLGAGKRAPLPAPLAGARRAEYLGERVRAGTAACLGAEIVDVPAPVEDMPLYTDARQDGKPPTCPAYRCRAQVRRSPTGDLQVDAVFMRRARRGAQQGDNVETEIEADLSGAEALTNGWLALTAALRHDEVQHDAWRVLVPPQASVGTPPLNRVSRRGPVEWNLHIGGAAAAALCADGRSLTQPMGLAVADEEAVVEVVCWFFPDDDHARGLFAREEIVHRLLSSPEPAGVITAACREAADRLPTSAPLLTPHAVRERVWQLGHYQLIYLFRETEDFPHD
ncbi:hypothetical protein OG711_22090 [Streptomyces uncialis]|uniref:hypothetical protein n=1 Tax=Streptomyces uncialis TaxID=1048205 RepID=UPI002E35EAB0|nr:hypothetical protein [Streptomyces uncialis]